MKPVYNFKASDDDVPWKKKIREKMNEKDDYRKTTLN